MSSNAEKGRIKEKFISSHMDDMTYREMAEALGIGYRTLINFVSRHGLSRDVRKKKWTAEDEEFLRNSYGLLRCREIADALGRTEASVNAKIQKMKLSREDCGKEGKKWSRQKERSER